MCGVPIGGSIALIIAARRNARVVRVIAINPYDYDEGKGMARSSVLGRVVVTLTDIPFVWDTVMRLRNYVIMKDSTAA